MNPRARRVRQRIERRASALQPDVERAWALGMTRLLDLVSESELEARIKTGLPMFTDAEIDRAFLGLALALRDGVERGARAAMAERRA